MATASAAPDPRQHSDAPERAPWQPDPDAWMGEPTETPSEAVERLLEEVSHVR